MDGAPLPQSIMAVDHCTLPSKNQTLDTSDFTPSDTPQQKVYDIIAIRIASKYSKASIQDTVSSTFAEAQLIAGCAL
jgi:hypothetical protein